MAVTYFSTDRLAAQAFEGQDAGPFAAVRGDPDVARFQSWETFTIADAQRLIAGNMDAQPGDAGWCQMAVRLKPGLDLVGDCGLHVDHDEPRLARIGYTLARSHWNIGLGTELIRGLTAFAFTTFPIHRISASVDPRNAGSCRVLEKAGYRREALHRQSVFFKGGWADDAVYALLRQECAGF